MDRAEAGLTLQGYWVWPRERPRNHEMAQSSKGPSQAKSYERGHDEQRQYGMKMIEMLDLKKGSTVLDLGCGTGDLTKVLSERVGPEGKVVAVDPDGERLKIARERYSASNIEYIEADDKTFPPGQYDVVFANYVLHRVDPRQ